MSARGWNWERVSANMQGKRCGELGCNSYECFSAYTVCVDFGKTCLLADKEGFIKH